VSAHIKVDLDRVHPVFDGRWHRVVHLTRLPQQGDPITMMCGRVEIAEYVGNDAQTPAQTCWGCDLEYRRQQGIPVLPDHPALVQPVPCPRQS
jgi:hypothetical protein